MGAEEVKHVIEIQDFSKEFLIELFDLAQKIEENPKDYAKKLDGRIIANLFFEPSTRTKDSFKSAVHRSGGTEVGFGSDESTSSKKGESLADTIVMYAGYSDVIVMRHPKDGSAKLASEYAIRANSGECIPIINGGDGQNQHPTQTMLDLYTIKKELGKLEGIKIAMVGDLKYGRTTHSLLYGAAMFDMDISLVAPEIVQMPRTYFQTAHKLYNAKPRLFNSIEEVISDVDVLYMTRIQKERFPDIGEYKKIAGSFVLDTKLMEKAQKTMRILHPLPRDSTQDCPEISPAVDKDKPRAAYFRQAENGVPVRRALLYKILGVE